jgi:hypothetical protein
MSIVRLEHYCLSRACVECVGADGDVGVLEFFLRSGDGDGGVVGGCEHKIFDKKDFCELDVGVEFRVWVLRVNLEIYREI